MSNPLEQSVNQENQEKATEELSIDDLAEANGGVIVRPIPGPTPIVTVS